MDKIAILGAGFVGSTTAFALMTRNIGSEIMLIDTRGDKAEGEAMDLLHGIQFAPGARITFSNDYAACEGSNIVVVCAGSAQKPGETRLDLVRKNAAIFKNMIPQVAAAAPDSVIIVVTNPVDILTHLAINYSGFPESRVFGTGTTLDSARFRFLLGRRFKVNPSSVHAYILGEHGDSEFPVWSGASIGGVNIKTLPDFDENEMIAIADKVKNAAYEIIAKKGATYYAIGLAVARLCESILRDGNDIYPVSCLLQDYYGISDVCLSIPAVIGRAGIVRKIKVALHSCEQDSFRNSAAVLKNILLDLAKD
ncbi:MAG: L-lactate dehydrogenase [bacterium]